MTQVIEKLQFALEQTNRDLKKTEESFYLNQPGTFSHSTFVTKLVNIDIKRTLEANIKVLESGEYSVEEIAQNHLQNHIYSMTNVRFDYGNSHGTEQEAKYLITKELLKIYIPFLPEAELAALRLLRIQIR